MAVAVQGDIDVADARIGYACPFEQFALPHAHAREAFDRVVAVKIEFRPQCGGSLRFAVHVRPAWIAGETVRDLPAAGLDPVRFRLFKQIVLQAFALQFQMDEIKLGGNIDGERAARQRLVVMDAEQFNAIDGCPEDMSVLLERQFAVGIRIRRARLFANLFVDDLRAWNDGFGFGGKWLGRKDFVAFHQRERAF